MKLNKYKQYEKLGYFLKILAVPLYHPNQINFNQLLNP